MNAGSLRWFIPTSILLHDEKWAIEKETIIQIERFSNFPNSKFFEFSRFKIIGIYKLGIFGSFQIEIF